MKIISVKFKNNSFLKSYNIKIEDDEFAAIFEKNWQNLTKGSDSVDTFDLLKAFMQTSYDNFCQVRKINKILKFHEEKI